MIVHFHVGTDKALSTLLQEVRLRRRWGQETVAPAGVSPSGSEPVHWGRVLGVLCAGLVLRIWHLQTCCLSHDEVFEMQAIQQSWNEFFWSADAFPPLHRTLLRGLFALTHNDMCGRWLSVACGMITLVALHGIGRGVGGATTGLAAAFLGAISPLQIYYAQESRAYGLYLAASAVAMWAFLACYRTDSRRAWIGFVAASVVGLYTHYYFTLLVGLLGGLWLHARWGRGPWKHGVWAFAILGAAHVPLLPLLAVDLSETVGYPEQTAFGMAACGYTFYSFLAGYCAGPSQAALHSLPTRDAVVAFLPYLIALTLSLTGPTVVGWRRLRDQRLLLMFLTLGIAPVALAGIAATGLHLNYSVRYVVFATIPVLVGCAFGWVGIRSALCRGAVLTALIGFTVVNLYHRNYVTEYQVEDMRGAARYIMRHSAQAPVDVHIDVNVGYMARPLRYYLEGGYNVTEFPEPGNPNGVVTVDSWQRLTDGPPRETWLVTTRTFHGDPAGHWRQLLPAASPVSPSFAQQHDSRRAASISHEATFAGVEVYRVRRPTRAADVAAHP